MLESINLVLLIFGAIITGIAVGNYFKKNAASRGPSAKAARMRRLP